jgi:cytoskeletal protein CcmA (bactofilin family)/anti-sigma factor RsiW
MSEPESRPGVPRDEHLDEMTGLLYLEGQLEPARARGVSQHTDDCRACRTLLRALERESRLLTRAMVEEDEALPARLLPAEGRQRHAMQWIWAAAFGLAATGVYALYTGYVQPWQQQLERAGFGGSSLLNLLVFQGAFWKGWQSMISLFEVLAVVTLGVGTVMFLRRRLRRTSAMALIFAGLLASVALPAPAGAADVSKDRNYVLRKDEVIHNDLYVGTGRGRIDGTVDGDLIIFCEALDVSGHITGDLIVFTRTLRVTGQVDGSIRAFANTTTLSGAVGRNVTSFSEVLTLDSSSKVGGGVTFFTQNAGLDGKIGRDIYSFFHDATITGVVGGNVWTKGDQLSIGSTAEIHGKTHFTGRKQPGVAAGAKLGSPLDFELWREEPAYRTGHYYVWKLIWTASVVLFGLVVFLLMPGFARDTVSSAERFGASLGLGVLVLFGVPIAAIIACITIIGIPIGAATVVVWLAALFAAQIAVGSVLGRWLLGSTPEIWGLIARMALGLVIVRLAYLIPHVGGWVKLGVILWGMGAISLAIYRRFQTLVPAALAVPAAVPTT